MQAQSHFKYLYAKSTPFLEYRALQSKPSVSPHIPTWNWQFSTLDLTVV
jgi:hypothetical protein